MIGRCRACMEPVEMRCACDAPPIARLRRIEAAAHRVRLAREALDLSDDGKHPDGTPYAPYQWEYAKELADTEMWDSIRALVGALAGGE